MKFTCNSHILSYAVHKCAVITQSSRTFPYLRDVRIEARGDVLTVGATDNYTFAKHYSHVDVIEEGVAIVDAKSLAAFLYVKSGDLTIHTTEKNLIANLDGNRVMLRLYTEGYPEFPKIPTATKSVKMDGGVLQNLLKVSAMADEDIAINAKFSGTLLLLKDGSCHAMATNKYRLGYAWTDIEPEVDTRFLVPQQTINILNTFIDPSEQVKIYHHVEGSKRRLFFVSDRFIISSAELAGDYPDEAITKMMSVDRQHQFSVNTDDFIGALKACKTMAGASTHAKAKTITVDTNTALHSATIKTAEENEIGAMDLSVTIVDEIGSAFMFDINSEFVDKAVGVLEKARIQSEFIDDKVTISLSEETSFVYISVRGVDSLFTIAPTAPPVIKNGAGEETSS